MKSLIACLLFLNALPINGQAEASFQLFVSDDTILMGNYFEIKFEATNLNGDFELPSFDGFQIMSGPNRSHNMSIQNGRQTSSTSITLLLKPESVDIHSIPPTYFVTSDKTWETSPRDIHVLPNPDEIITDSRLESQINSFNFFDPWNSRKREPAKKKKKLKETKI